MADKQWSFPGDEDDEDTGETISPEEWADFHGFVADGVGSLADADAVLRGNPTVWIFVTTADVDRVAAQIGPRSDPPGYAPKLVESVLDGGEATVWVQNGNVISGRQSAPATVVTSGRVPADRMVFATEVSPDLDSSMDLPDHEESQDIADVGSAVLLVDWRPIPGAPGDELERVAVFARYVRADVTALVERHRMRTANRVINRYAEMVEVYDTILRHDIGNDLQVITGFSDALQLMIEDDETIEYLERIYRTAEHAAELIADASNTVSTLKDGAEPEPIDLEPVLSKAIKRCCNQYASLSVEYDPAAFDTAIYADELLRTVFEQILANAAIHTDGEVTVAVYRERPADGELLVGFTDDGTGIPEVILDELFRMGKHGPDSEGSGFGLGLARTIVESYGGSITVRETDGGGADFRVRFRTP